MRIMNAGRSSDASATSVVEVLEFWSGRRGRDAGKSIRLTTEFAEARRKNNGQSQRAVGESTDSKRDTNMSASPFSVHRSSLPH